jgi:hypothetical protein
MADKAVLMTVKGVVHERFIRPSMRNRSSTLSTLHIPGTTPSANARRGLINLALLAPDATQHRLDGRALRPVPGSG